MKSVAVNTTLLKSITVLHKTDFTTMGHYQLNLIQITHYRKTWPQSSLKQCRYYITTLFKSFQYACFGLIFQKGVILSSFQIQF